MAFENVNVSSLKNSLMQCKNTINHSISSELINNISNVSIWQSSSQNNLKNALTTLVNQRYSDLENKINSYFNIVSYIERYQNLRGENESLENQYLGLSNKLYYTRSYTVDVLNSDGTTTTETRYEDVKDIGVESQMFDIRRRIDNNNEEMENLKNRVSNSI